MDSDDEEETEKSKIPKFPLSMYITEGNKYLTLCKYDKAIEFFDAALERDSANEKSLIELSKCKMRLAKFSEAKQAAEEALRVNNKSPEASILIGEAEYVLGDFEKSFLTFYRGYKSRPDFERLRLGYQMCRKAIENALQPDKPIIFDDKDISNLGRVKVEKQNKVSNGGKENKDFLSSDVDFVNSLLEDSSISSVHPICNDLKKFLKKRQLFWRTQNPTTSKPEKRTIADSQMENDVKESTKKSTTERECSENDFEGKDICNGIKTRQKLRAF